MSLYDTIRCEYPLPDAALQGEEFQTKDLNRSLGRYTIASDGRLCLRHLPKSDPVPAPKHPDMPEGPSGTEVIPHHGDLRIYASGAKGPVHPLGASHNETEGQGRPGTHRPAVAAPG